MPSTVYFGKTSDNKILKSNAFGVYFLSFSPTECHIKKKYITLYSEKELNKLKMRVMGR